MNPENRNNNNNNNIDIEKINLSTELENNNKSTTNHQVGVTQEDGTEPIMGRDRGANEAELDFASFAGDTGKKKEDDATTTTAGPSSLNNTQKLLDESTKRHDVIDDDEAILQAAKNVTNNKNETSQVLPKMESSINPTPPPAAPAITTIIEKIYPFLLPQHQQLQETRCWQRILNNHNHSFQFHQQILEMPTTIIIIITASVIILLSILEVCNLTELLED
jgi:hypothetical protein